MKTQFTIMDIAAKAGVSIATVSRVLNNKGNVKSSTRDQVLRILRDQELSNKSDKIYQIICIKGSELDTISNMMLSSIQDYCNRNQILLVTNIVTSLEQFRFLLQNFNDEPLLLIGDDIPPEIIDSLFEETKKVVTIGTTKESSQYFNIGVDQIQAVNLLIQMIRDFRHTHIVCFAQKQTSNDDVAAMEFLRRKTAENDIRADIYYIDRDTFAYEMTLGMFENPEHATLIVTPDDIVTRDCLRALNELNLSVPRDVSVVQKNNYRQIGAERLVSCIVYPLDYMAEQIFRFLSLDIETLHDIRVLIPPREIIGETCSRKGTRRLSYIKTMTCWIGPEPFGILEKRIIEDWIKNHADNTIIYNQIPEGASTEQVIQNAVVSGTAPGIIFNLEPFFANFLGVRGILTPLDTLDGFDELVAARKMERYIELIRARYGHVYMLPQSWTPILTSYNATALNELGVGVPKTFRDNIELMKKIPGNSRYIHSSIKRRPIWWVAAGWWHSLYMSCGGDFREKPLMECLSSELSLEILRYLSDGVAMGKIHVSDNAKNNTSDKTPICCDTVTPLSFSNKNPDDLKDYILTAPPCITSNVNVDATVKGVGILNERPSLSDRWDFVRLFFREIEYDKEIMRTTFQLPCRVDLLSNAAFSEIISDFPVFKTFIEYQERAFTISDENKMEVFTNFITAVWEPVVGLRKTPESALYSFIEKSSDQT